jgi:hypothetical protein
MQPVTEGPASQGDDGDFLALGPAGALEQEDQLFLLGAFANQAQHPTVPPYPSPRTRHSRAGGNPEKAAEGWILSLRGNDGYFDRLILKKARVVHENLRGNVSLCPLSSVFRHLSSEPRVSRWLDRNLV